MKFSLGDLYTIVVSTISITISIITIIIQSKSKKL